MAASRPQELADALQSCSRATATLQQQQVGAVPPVGWLAEEPPAHWLALQEAVQALLKPQTRPVLPAAPAAQPQLLGLLERAARQEQHGVQDAAWFSLVAADPACWYGDWRA